MPLADLPVLYGLWIEAERKKLAGLPVRRRETAERLIAEMETASATHPRRHRYPVSQRDCPKRLPVHEPRRRHGGAAPQRRRHRRSGGTAGTGMAAVPARLHSAQHRRPFRSQARRPRDRRPAVLPDRRRQDRGLSRPRGLRDRPSTADRPGRARRRRRRHHALHAAPPHARPARPRGGRGLRARADAHRSQERRRKGRRLLGDWPIEIGLWVGSDASPNKLGGKGNADQTTAVGRVRRYRTGRDKRAPAPLKACPWCGTAFTAHSFACVPNELAPTNLEIRCVNTACDFTRGRPLPILTVDEPIYRRLPAFLIATVDKVRRACPGSARPARSSAMSIDIRRASVSTEPQSHGRAASSTTVGRSIRPDLIIQDELHLISGPLGTVAGLYEAAIDQLASRRVGGKRIRPKIVASTATVRRASDQI